MFGSNQNNANTGFGFGTNTNQGTGAFGTTNPGGAFGTTNTTSAFGGGGTGAFGQRPNTGLFGSGTTTSTFGQPQQNTTTPAFGSGGFGSTTNTVTTSPFGSTTNTSGGLFGSKPATTGFGSGAFGSSTGSGFGSGSAFGSTTNTSTPSAFGSSTAPLGGLGFGQQQQNATPVPVTGTSNPPYQIFSEKEQGQTFSTNFHAITMMPAYRNASFEELRLADYAQGRRYGTGGAFGTPSAFGGTTTGTPSAFGGFGSNNTTTPAATSAFGQPTQTNAPGFGTGAFGGGSTAGGFGSNTTGAFGQATPQTPAFGTNTSGFGTGGFSSGSTTGAFGSTPNTGGAFGAAKPAFGLGTSGFGSSTNTTNTGGFGTNTGTTGAFGTLSNTTGAFGSTNTTPATNAWGGFGSNPQQQSGGFGINTTNQDNKPAFGGFGTNTANTATPSGGAFGFGQKPATSFGGFGGGSSFGNNASTTGALGGFGTNTTTPQSTGTGLGGFGSGGTNTSGGFGSGSSFFNKPPTSAFGLGAGGLGSNTSNSGSTFNSGSSGGFGGGSGFGLGNTNQNNLGSSMFGNQTPQQNAQLQQSVMSSPYGNNPLFQMNGASSYGGDATKPIAPIASLVPKEGKDDKNPAILAGFRLTPGGGKSRFSTGTGGSPLGSSPFSSRKRDIPGLGTPTKVLLNTTPTGIELTPEAFVVPKKGLKTLEISRTKRDLLTGGDTKALESPGSENGFVGTSKSSTVDPRLEREAREKERQRIEQESRRKTEAEVAKQKPSISNGTPSSSKPTDNDAIPPPPPPQGQIHILSPTASTITDRTLDIANQDEGSYWTMPSMSQILKMRDVHAVNNFVVGRKGYGQVRFTQPVDLSQVRSIPDIPGTVVVLDSKICTIYPDETTKPPVGRGLNVPAIITLEKCWPLSKETRQPIVDVENPRFIAHVERLKRQPDTEFIDYIADTGSWIFKVKHF